jgi:GTP-binding protein of the ras superfamily involved in termination of M-phase
MGEEGADEESLAKNLGGRLTLDEGAAGSGAMHSKLKRNSLVVKVGMVGDAQIGKTSLMVKYVEGKFDSDYIETLGVNFMEKSIALKNAEVTFSIWDLGGEREFISMLPLVCNDALVILFMFDLSRKSTLTSVKEWYRQVRGLNKQAFAFLVGTKYDVFAALPHDHQKDITKQARKFAKAMKAPLIFCSSSHSINVQKVFKIIFGTVFDVDPNVEPITKVGDPLIEFPGDKDGAKEHGDEVGKE